MDGALRQVTFRVEHDCPMARLSRAWPQADFHCWSGHRLEVVEVRGPRQLWPGVAASIEEHLAPERVLRVPDGAIVVWEPHVEAERSISRTLEAHDTMWLQPMHVAAGWEHYDAIVFDDAGAQAALTALSRSWPTQVVRRRTIGPGDLLASLFLSLRPALEAPTGKQAQALLAAARAGYYRSPRGATTAQVAKRMGLGRSAFEERLRGAENRILSALVPALEHHRVRPEAPRPGAQPPGRPPAGVSGGSRRQPAARRRRPPSPT